MQRYFKHCSYCIKVNPRYLVFFLFNSLCAWFLMVESPPGMVHACCRDFLKIPPFQCLWPRMCTIKIFQRSLLLRAGLAAVWTPPISRNGDDRGSFSPQNDVQATYIYPPMLVHRQWNPLFKKSLACAPFYSL